jgi:hypothetical protein
MLASVVAATPSVAQPTSELDDAIRFLRNYNARDLAALKSPFEPKVLVCGYGNCNTLTLAELFDPRKRGDTLTADIVNVGRLSGHYIFVGKAVEGDCRRGFCMGGDAIVSMLFERRNGRVFRISSMNVGYNSIVMHNKTDF